MFQPSWIRSRLLKTIEYPAIFNNTSLPAGASVPYIKKSSVFYSPTSKKAWKKYLFHVELNQKKIGKMKLHFDEEEIFFPSSFEGW